MNLRSYFSKPVSNSVSIADINSDKFFWIITAFASVCHFAIAWLIISPFASDMDTVNFVYSVDRFDITQLSPHPPGYLPYVLLLKALSAVSGKNPIDIVNTTSVFFSSATVAVIAICVRKLGFAQLTSVITMLLATFHPFLIFHAADGQTHAAEGFFAACLFMVLLSKNKNRQKVISVAVLFSLGISLRPSFALMTIGPIIFSFRKDKVLLLMVFCTAAVASLLWLIPSIVLTGKLSTFVQANRTFIVDEFTTPANRFEVAAFNLAAFMALLLMPLLPVLYKLRYCHKNLLILTALAAIPSIIFFLLTFIVEPGYLQSLVPLIIILVADAASKTRLTKLSFAIVFLIQITILLMPQGGSISLKMPSIPELVHRQIMGEAVLNAVNKPFKPKHTLLFITDFSGAPYQRQLPLLRPNTHVLWLYMKSSSLTEPASLSHSTDKTMTPIPGPVMLAIGKSSQFNTNYKYDYIVLDPMLTEANKKLVLSQTDCDGTAVEHGLIYFPSNCFITKKISFGKFVVLFR